MSDQSQIRADIGQTGSVLVRLRAAHGLMPPPKRFASGPRALRSWRHAVPNLEGKHAGRPYVTARRLLDYHDARGTAALAVPRAVVLT